MASLILQFLGFAWIVLSLRILVKAINKKDKATTTLIEEMYKLAGGMQEDFGVVRKYVVDAHEVSNAPLYNSFKVPILKGGNTRVFGFVLFKALTKQFQLVMTPASNIEDARKNASALMANEGWNISEWKTLVEGVVDIQTEPLIKEVEVKKADKPVDEFLHSLMYARDHLTTDPKQKSVLSDIIINLEKKHAGKKS